MKVYFDDYITTKDMNNHHNFKKVVKTMKSGVNWNPRFGFFIGKGFKLSFVPKS